MTETQNSLENRINALTEEISQSHLRTSSQNTSQNFNQQEWSKYSRGRLNQNRGIRGYYNGEGSNTYQNPNQNQGKYGNNFRGILEQEILSEETITDGTVVEFSNYENRKNIFQYYDNQNAGTAFITNAEGHIETTAFSQKLCYSCGYPNHTSKKCEARGRPNSQGGQIPFNSQSKN